MSREYRLISADSHLEIDTKYWRDRVIEKHRDRVPRMVRTELGGDRWVVEGEYTTEVPLDLYAGKGVQSDNDRWTPFGQRYEDTPGTGTAQQRVREQDQDGIDAEVLFQSSASRWWRNIRDDDAYNAVLRGYNAWLAEEYCAVAPERLIGVGALPISNVDDAVAEMEHCKKLGLKSVALRAFPSNKGYPTAEDDRFWAASLDLEMPVSIHVELDRTGERNGPVLLYPKEPPQLRKDSARAPAADFVRQVARFHQLGGLNVIQMLLHGLFYRFPNSRCTSRRPRRDGSPIPPSRRPPVRAALPMGQELFGWEPLKHGLPSEYVKRHIYWGIVHDRVGVEMRHHVGVNRIMRSTTFRTKSPSGLDLGRSLKNMMLGVPEKERYQMVTGNCVEFFRLAGN